MRVALRKHAERAGLRLAITPHMLRHILATLLLEEGVNIQFIQRLLGHSSIVTTQIYTEVAERGSGRFPRESTRGGLAWVLRKQPGGLKKHPGVL